MMEMTTDCDKKRNFDLVSIWFAVVGGSLVSPPPLLGCCWRSDVDFIRLLSKFILISARWLMTKKILVVFDRRAGTPRPVWNAASQILMAVGYILLALALPGSLYIGSIIVGICYGVRVAVSVPLASELFGLKYYGLLYNILILNLPLGSFLFSGLLAGFLYDSQATRKEGGGTTCIGPHCYRLVFVIMSIACLVGCCLDVVLSVRTKVLYSKIYASQKSDDKKAVVSS